MIPSCFLKKFCAKIHNKINVYQAFPIGKPIMTGSVVLPMNNYGKCISLILKVLRSSLQHSKALIHFSVAGPLLGCTREVLAEVDGGTF